MRRGTFLVLLAAVCWGTTFPGIRYGLTVGEMAPYAFVYYRFLVATIAIFAVAAARRRIDWHLFADWRILLLSIVNALGYVLQFLAQDRTTASKTALLVNVNVLITALLAYAILKERISRATKWGVGLGFIGVVLLTTSGEFSTVRFSNREFVGDLLAFGTGVCWTVYILVLKDYFTKHPATDNVSLVAVLFTVTSIVLFPVTWWTEGLAFTGNGHGVLMVLYLGIFSSVGAFLLYQEGLKTTSAAVSSVLLLIEPLLAVGIAVAVFSETFSLWAAAGAVLIMAATYFASRAPPALPSDAVRTASS